MSAPGALQLQFMAIQDRGQPNLERVLFRAIAPVNTAFHVVLHSTASDTTTVSSGGRLSYWFPAVQLAAGEQILLFTGHNLNPQNASKQGRTFFWGLQKTIFNTAEDCIVLMQVANWQTFGYLPVSPPPAALPGLPRMPPMTLSDLLKSRPTGK